MTYLKPSDLTAEERAIVDHEASRFHRDWTAEARYKTAFDICKSFILARRALFAPPASEEKVTCPNCLQKVPSELEHYHSGYHDDNYTVEPHYVCEQQISELDDRHNRMVSPEYQAKVKAEMARRAVEIGVDRLVGVATSPVSETVTVGAWQLEELLKYADYAEVALRTGFHPPDFIFEPADRSLRQCIDAIKEQRDKWRSQPAPTPPSEMPIDRARQIAAQCWCDPETESIEMDARLAEAFARRLVEFRRSQPAPAVAMTEELEHVLASAEYDAGYSDATGHSVAAKATRSAIAAVRAQASQPQGVKMRGLIMQAQQCAVVLDNRGAPTNAEALRLWADAALAELDAAEWKVTG